MTSVRIPQDRDRPGWRCPDPRLLPELRGELATWLAEPGADFYLEMTLIGSQLVRPVAPDLVTAATRLAADERRRVTDGDLYWIAPEMLALARHAGQQLTTHELYVHDLPSRSGFMVFAEPLAVTTYQDMAAEIAAVSWGVMEPPIRLNVGGKDVPFGPDWKAGAVWFTFWSDPRSFLTANFPGAPDLAGTWARTVGPFMPDNELLWALDRPAELPKGTEYTSAWGRSVVAAWLMRQPLAAETRERAPRPARRRLEKVGLPGGDIRLVHVRRPETRRTAESSEGPPSREYTCQWFVEGHWRTYHVGPGRSRAERRYI